MVRHSTFPTRETEPFIQPVQVGESWYEELTLSADDKRVAEIQVTPVPPLPLPQPPIEPMFYVWVVIKQWQLSGRALVTQPAFFYEDSAEHEVSVLREQLTPQERTESIMFQCVSIPVVGDRE
jgi:hypothetical protein